jgi:predicted GH43/DUF377 family glycosyl hydrolase
MTITVRRSSAEILAHPSRVISRPFDPGHDGLIRGRSRSQGVIERVLAMTECDVLQTLGETLALYSNRHDDLRATFRRHFELIAHPSVTAHPNYSQERAELVGAYFTQEYSIEGAALFNPSIVIAPDQSGCGENEVRFILSLRAVGEGHLSSIEFRSGVLGAADSVVLDPPSPHLTTGEHSQAPIPCELLRAALHQSGESAAIDGLLQSVPQEFTVEAFERVLESPECEQVPADARAVAMAALRRIADASYELVFSQTSKLSERVIFPGTAAESHGLEDARFIQFLDDDGGSTYLGTYTAYDGVSVRPHLLQTDDFRTFRISPMLGEAAQDKGMALFPRKINGDMWCLSRWDRENISIARLERTTGWSRPQVVQAPHQPWELIKLGACSSPIETPAGWLVLTHGVGPMRTYAIGALLLDLDDPSKVIGVLAEPLLMPAETERDGYVPNVVYSCGALVHKGTLVLPYGCSDASVRFAFVELADILASLLAQSQGIEEAVS